MREPNVETVLETHGLVKTFRGFRAVDGVDLSVHADRIHALVGPNGAGKTTLFNMLCGFIKPSAGQVTFRGEDVTGLPPDRLARKGIGRSFQITSLFEQLRVVEHVELALQSASGLGYRFWLSDRVLGRYRPQALDILSQVDLDGLAEREVHTLPYGQKRALELALVLAVDPVLVLLDEPTAGMGVEDVARVTALIRRISRGRSVVLVEHNMGIIAELADHVTVLHQGRVLAAGTYDQVRHDERVIAVYLGQVDQESVDQADVTS
jgi:branched-chain amino acid transport system ATP-binding protein